MSIASSSGSDCDYIFKVIVIGDSGVGKSSLTVRLSEDVFYKDYASTIAIDFRMYFMTLNDKRIRLQIWDTAGQERFQSVATAFYRGANGVLLCFDLTHRPSFLHLDQWLNRVKEESLPGVPCLLVGCKLDETRGAGGTPRQVTREEAEAWAKTNGMAGYLETSAKDKDNVNQAFQQMTESIFTYIKERGNNNSGSGGGGGSSGGGGKHTVSMSGGKGSKKDKDGEGSGGCGC